MIKTFEVDAAGKPGHTMYANSRAKGASAKIAIPTFEGLQMINISDIIKFMADESYTHISFINNARMTVSRNLKEYEDMLFELNFFRVHKSCLINLAQVSKYIKGEGGYVIMSDGSSVEVSRRKKIELLTRLSLVQF